MGLMEDLASLQAQRESSAIKHKGVIQQLIALSQDSEASPDTQGNLAPASGAVERRMMGSDTPVGGLDKGFQDALNKLIKATGGKVKINSGYRSPERQAQLFAAAVKKYGSEAAARKWVAPPGKSHHNEGIAADLGFADAATRQRVHAMAAQYGLTFPMAYEPWHVEPIRRKK